MDKKDVIVFGGGRLFEEREIQILESYNIVAIADNNIDSARHRWDNYTIINPTELGNYRDIDIIIVAAEAIVDITLQIASIIGYKECERKVRFAKFEFPLYDWEKEASQYNTLLEITDTGIRFTVDEGTESSLLIAGQGYKELYRFIKRQKDPFINVIVNMPLTPTDKVFGLRRGTPVDRYYIHSFLDNNRSLIRGRCLEIAENKYTKEFGENRVTESVILHVNGWGENAIKGNLETGEGINENDFDSMIITQTLMFIHDINRTIKNIYKALKNSGTALITVAGISKISKYDDENWGMYHSFYRAGLEKAVMSVFGKSNVEIVHYGNVKTAIGFLYGIVVEELNECDFDYIDEEYPVIYGIVAKKVACEQ